MRIFRKYMDIMRQKLVESKKQKTITSFFMPVDIQEVDWFFVIALFVSIYLYASYSQ